MVGTSIGRRGITAKDSKNSVLLGRKDESVLRGHKDERISGRQDKTPTEKAGRSCMRGNLYGTSRERHCGNGFILTA